MLKKVILIFIGTLAVVGFFGGFYTSLGGSAIYAAYFIILGVILVMGFLAIILITFDLFKKKVVVSEVQINEKPRSKILITALIVSVLVLSVFYLGMAGKIDGFLLFLQQLAN